MHISLHRIRLFKSYMPLSISEYQSFILNKGRDKNKVFKIIEESGSFSFNPF